MVDSYAREAIWKLKQQVENLQKRLEELEEEWKNYLWQKSEEIP